ncbi:hypothetical protein DSO57_1019320 [Entomophthora muscae]|uniref:Uncharacterized protein n=1 Tax=Entomophthora muscae TaxID=34485 RepID=A0ACC2TRM5_9FUNG|nr:hypothetical protein DSO57_1019320 [Entomophthora muscae]
MKLQIRYCFWEKVLLLYLAFKLAGNFSFSSALCKMFGNGSNVWATSYDSEDVLKQKYSDDCANHIEFVKGCGGKVFYGIDGTKLEKHRKTFLLAHNNEAKEQEGFVQNSFGSNFRNTNEIFFDKIVINFPHCGLGIKDQRKNILANQKLLSGILKSARSLAHPKTGQLHITIKSGLPYELWRVAALAKEEGHWHQTSCIPFNPNLYPGYEHRRTLGFEAGISSSQNVEIKEKYPKTYVFSLSSNVTSKNTEAAKNNKE